MKTVRRVVIVGRGAAGKSALAVQLADLTRLPLIELDKIFWRPGLVATPRDRWAAMQQELVTGERWIMDGDLGPYDVIDVRLRAADTVIFLDFPLIRCAWRAIRRSRERADFWRWLLAYGRQSRPLLMHAIGTHAAGADVHILRSPRAQALRRGGSPRISSRDRLVMSRQTLVPINADLATDRHSLGPEDQRALARLPAEYPSPATRWRRLRRWDDDGAWGRIWPLRLDTQTSPLGDATSVLARFLK